MTTKTTMVVVSEDERNESSPSNMEIKPIFRRTVSKTPSLSLVDKTRSKTSLERVKNLANKASKKKFRNLRKAKSFNLSEFDDDLIHDMVDNLSLRENKYILRYSQHDDLKYYGTNFVKKCLELGNKKLLNFILKLEEDMDLRELINLSIRKNEFYKIIKYITNYQVNLIFSRFELGTLFEKIIKNKNLTFSYLIDISLKKDMTNRAEIFIKEKLKTSEKLRNSLLEEEDRLKYTALDLYELINNDINYLDAFKSFVYCSNNEDFSKNVECSGYKYCNVLHYAIMFNEYEIVKIFINARQLNYLEKAIDNDGNEISFGKFVLSNFYFNNIMKLLSEDWKKRKMYGGDFKLEIKYDEESLNQNEMEKDEKEIIRSYFKKLVKFAKSD